MAEYIDQPSEEEKNLLLHLAKMFEHSEWENTLPQAEKSKRRLARYVGGLGQAAQVAAENDMPWLFLGQLERIFFHVCQIFGPEWMEKASERRRVFFEEDDEYDIDIVEEDDL